MLWMLICGVPLVYVLIWYFPILWSLIYLLLLAIFIILSVFTLSLWGHIALSSPYHIPPFLIERIEKEVRQFGEALKVKLNVYIFFLNATFQFNFKIF